MARGLGRGLTGYWPLDDGPGARQVRDHSGAERHCLIREVKPGPAAVWVPGAHGQGLSLDARLWLQCPQPAFIREQPSELTVAAWVRRHSAPAHQMAVVTRQIDLGYEDQFFLGFNADSLRVVSHAWHGGASAPAPVPSDQWHHVAFTRDREGATRLYLDGVEVSRSVGAPRGSGAVTSAITIGAGRYSRFPGRVRQRFDGAVDEVLAYDRVLSALELRALAARVRPLLAGDGGNVSRR